MIRIISILILLAGLLVFLGCSANGASPVLPADDNSSNSQNGSLLGIYTMTFDIENMSVSVAPNRESGAHFNVTSYLPAPGIHLNSFDPGTMTADVDVTISNTFDLDGHDLRLIIFTDAVGHKLVNFDSWTGFFDIAGGLPINPFKAYRTSDPNRMFPGKSDDVRNLQIYLPGGNPNVTFAIEASYPSNCEEPYEINNFNQGVLYDTVGAIANVTVDIYDWQSDVFGAFLYCPALTGGPIAVLTQVNATEWEYNFANTTGAAEGNYTGYVFAESSDVRLYTEVVIEVTHQTSGVDPVGDLVVVAINRGDSGVDAEQISSVDFDWEDSNGAVEYAFERADGYTGTGWTVDGVTRQSDYNFIPTGYDLDDDIRFRVIARAVAGGDPLTDADPSEEVFILFMSNMGDMGGSYENSWTFTRKDPTDGIYLTRWYWNVDEWGECGIGFYGNNSIAKDTNTWAIAYTQYEVPDLDGMSEAWFDGYISPGANWDPATLGFCMGTISETPTPGQTCPDFEPATEILGPQYFAYNNPNCGGINDQFGETNQDAWRLTPDFDPVHVWRHVGYYLNDLLDPDRDYIALGYANGNIPLTPGTT
ncbi:hypothetical protein J7L05_09420 [bacterium]|nr:hypothetical protein [bacterium]